VEIGYSEGRQKEIEELVIALQKNHSSTPALLDDVINEISLTGLCCYPWYLIKELLAVKLTQLLDRYYTEGPNAQVEKQRLCAALKNFEDPPFTLQRLCELLNKNNATYKTLKTFTFAIEKVLYVSLTTPILKPEEYNQKVKELLTAKSVLASNPANQDHGSIAARRVGGSGHNTASGDSSPNNHFDPMDIDKD